MSEKKEPKDQRIPIMMSESEVTAIDDWAFSNRIRSRGEAIRRLCQIALVLDLKLTPILEATKNYADENGKFMKHSSESLLNSSSMSKKEQEREIITSSSMMLSAAVAWSKLQLNIREVIAKAYAFKQDGSLDKAIKDVKNLDNDFSEIIARFAPMNDEITSGISDSIIFDALLNIKDEK